MAVSLTHSTRLAPYSPSALAMVSSVSPNTTATGSPSRRASVRSSKAGFDTCESTWSATTKTSDINASYSDVLSGSQEIDQCRCAVLFLDHPPRFLGRTRAGLQD